MAGELARANEVLNQRKEAIVGDQTRVLDESDLIKEKAA